MNQLSVSFGVEEMSSGTPIFERKPMPISRRIVSDFLVLGQRRPAIHALVELDISKPRQFIRKHKESTGETLSFTAFVVSCVGHAIDKNKQMHAYPNWRNQLIVFDDVDVTTIVEIELEGKRFPFAHILRAVNKRSFRSIHDEIRSIQTKPKKSKGFDDWKFMRWFLYLPRWVRLWFYRLAMLSPHFVKQYTGTVSVTAVGMFGTGSGWGIPIPSHNLSVTVGGISEKPVVLDGAIGIGEFLNLTISANHDIIDGAPLVRFIQAFKTLLESGDGLCVG